jgi:hypothetical protein
MPVTYTKTRSRAPGTLNNPSFASTEMTRLETDGIRTSSEAWVSGDSLVAQFLITHTWRSEQDRTDYINNFVVPNQSAWDEWKIANNVVDSTWTKVS